MTNQQVIAELNPIFRDLFGDDTIEVTEKTTAKDIPGWDSYKQVNILIAVEQHFKVKFKSREIDRLQQVGDMASLVSSKLS